MEGKDDSSGAQTCTGVSVIGVPGQNVTSSWSPTASSIAGDSTTSSHDSSQDQQGVTMSREEFSSRGSMSSVRSMSSSDSMTTSPMSMAPSPPTRMSVAPERLVHPRQQSLRGWINFQVKREDLLLKINIIKCEELPAMDSDGASDPYVKIDIEELRHKPLKTRVKKKTLNPSFNEEFIFEIERSLHRVTLRLEVWDHDRFKKDDFIGQMRTELLVSELPDECEDDVWTKLGPKESEVVDFFQLGQFSYGSHLTNI